MRELNSRKQRGIEDVQGQPPSRDIPTGEALLAVGTAKQTKLAGSPVKGPVFDFAPAIDEYIKTHLFGDIFERDNLDWQSRQIATVGMLSSMLGLEPQLQSHMRISMNVGITASQLATCYAAPHKRFTDRNKGDLRTAAHVSFLRTLEPRTVPAKDSILVIPPGPVRRIHLSAWHSSC